MPTTLCMQPLCPAALHGYGVTRGKFYKLGLWKLPGNRQLYPQNFESSRRPQGYCLSSVTFFK